MVTVIVNPMLVAIPVTHAKMDILLWKRAITLGVKGVSVTSVEPSPLCAAGAPESASAESMSWGRPASGLKTTTIFRICITCGMRLKMALHPVEEHFGLGLILWSFQSSAGGGTLR